MRPWPSCERGGWSGRRIRGSRTGCSIRAGPWAARVAVFLRDLQASGRPETTLRAYAVALLRSLRDLAGQVGREAGRVAVCNQWLRIFNVVLLR